MESTEREWRNWDERKKILFHIAFMWRVQSFVVCRAVGRMDGCVYVCECLFFGISVDLTMITHQMHSVNYKR